MDTACPSPTHIEHLHIYTYIEKQNIYGGKDRGLETSSQEYRDMLITGLLDSEAKEKVLHTPAATEPWPQSELDLRERPLSRGRLQVGFPEGEGRRSGEQQLLQLLLRYLGESCRAGGSSHSHGYQRRAPQATDKGFSRCPQLFLLQLCPFSSPQSLALL